MDKNRILANITLTWEQWRRRKKLILIMSENYNIAERLAKKMQLKKWKYVDSLEDVYGYNDCELWCCGDFWLNPLYKDFQKLLSYCHFWNIKIVLDWRKYMKWAVEEWGKKHK